VVPSKMQGKAVVGWYNAAYNLVAALAFIPMALVTAVFPLMSRLYESSNDSLRFSYEKSFKYLLIIGFPIGVGGTFLANRIITLIYGFVYSPAIIAFQILVWSQVFVFLNVVLGTLLNSINRQTAYTKQCGLAAVLNVVLNLILIPKYSYVGASIATVATQCFVFIAMLRQVSKGGYSIVNKSTLGLAIKVVAASLLMGIFIAHFINLNLAILVVSSALIYFALVYLFRGIDKTDIELAKQLSRRDENRK